MFQGLFQTLLVHLPMSYYMSIQPDASLTKIGLAAPASTTDKFIILQKSLLTPYFWCKETFLIAIFLIYFISLFLSEMLQYLSLSLR